MTQSADQEERVEIAPPPGQPDPTLDLLLMAWLEKLADDSRKVTGKQGLRMDLRKPGSECSFTLENEGTLKVRVASKRRIALTASGAEGRSLAEIAREAMQRTNARETGDPVWWTASYTSSTLGTGSMLQHGGLHFMRVMSEQLHREGWWRLGQWAALEFVRDPPLTGNDDGLASAILKVRAVFRTTGPCHAQLSEDIAAVAGGIIQTLCALASGVSFEALFAPVWPANDDQIAEAEQEFERAAELTAAIGNDRRLVQVWPVVGAWLNWREIGPRIRNALGAWEAAIEQRNGQAAVALLVTAMEALATPSAQWKANAPTRRFITFIDDLCPDALATIMKHGNFAAAFGPKKSRRSLLDHVYDLRSSYFHEGFGPRELRWHSPDFADQARIALLSELTREAIVAYALAPRSSLVGWGEG